MPRLALLLLSYLGFPVLLSIKGWLPLVVGSTGPELARAQLNVEALLYLIPSVALAGIALSLMYPRQAFETRHGPVVIGLVSGAFACLVTYTQFPHPIVNPKPLLFAAPGMGLACGLLFMGLNWKLRIRRGEVAAPRLEYRLIDVTALPLWRRPFAWYENSLRRRNPKRLLPRYRRLHQTLGMVSGLLAVVALWAIGMAITLSTGTDPITYAKEGQQPQAMFVFMVGFIALVGLVIPASFAIVAAPVLFFARRWGWVPPVAYGQYLRGEDFPRSWLRDEAS